MPKVPAMAACVLVVDDSPLIRKAIRRMIEPLGFDVNEAAEIIRKTAHPEANIIFGAVLDESMSDTINITVIATGFDGAAQQQPALVRSVAKQASAMPFDRAPCSTFRCERTTLRTWTSQRSCASTCGVPTSRYYWGPAAPSVSCSVADEGIGGWM